MAFLSEAAIEQALLEQFCGLGFSECFNGAAHLGAEKAPRRGPHATGSPCFNGAAHLGAEKASRR